jgi:uncharacterized membrane protein YkoI
MSARLKGILIAVPVVAALAVGGAAIAGATGGDDGTARGDDDRSDKPIAAGGALDRASAVALKHTGGGRVTATEVGDEEGYYEVEVRRADGSQVDVHLDRDFNLIGGQADGDGADGSNDD